MSSRKPLLINVPKVEPASANTSSDLDTIVNRAEIAARIIREKVDSDVQRQRELVESITDGAMRRSLKE